jgi:hypothetical protein
MTASSLGRYTKPCYGAILRHFPFANQSGVNMFVDREHLEFDESNVIIANCMEGGISF